FHDRLIVEESAGFAAARAEAQVRSGSRSLRRRRDKRRCTPRDVDRPQVAELEQNRDPVRRRARTVEEPAGDLTCRRLLPASSAGVMIGVDALPVACDGSNALRAADTEGVDELDLDADDRGARPKACLWPGWGRRRRRR